MHAFYCRGCVRGAGSDSVYLKLGDSRGGICSQVTQNHGGSLGSGVLLLWLTSKPGRNDALGMYAILGTLPRH
jgi:hypothetical protein